MIKKIFQIVFLILISISLVCVSVAPVIAGGWFKKITRNVYRGVKRTGQIVIEKPARRLFGKKEKEKENKNLYNDREIDKPGSKIKFAEQERTKVPKKKIDKIIIDYTQKDPEEKGSIFKNKKVRIEKIIGLIDFISKDKINKKQIRIDLSKLSTLQLNHLYYGLLTHQENKFIEKISLSIKSDLSHKNYLSGGFVTYNLSTMNLRKMNNMFRITDEGKLTWNKTLNFPDIAESFWIQTIMDKKGRYQPTVNEIRLAQGASLDGWLVVYNKIEEKFSVYYFVPEGFFVDCYSSKLVD